MSVEDSLARKRALVSRFQQEHLLSYWGELNATERAVLLEDLEAIDLERCAGLIETLVRNKPKLDQIGDLEPPFVYPARPGPDLESRYRDAREVGVAAMRGGEVAAFTVAGGQGTRLGFEGPKGAFAISPVRNAPLFQLFAEQLVGVQRRYGVRPPWYIMTSPANHGETTTFFQANRWFGLSEGQIRFFPQGQMPAFLPDGRIALAEKHRIALSPDGHGGSLRALAESGALADMRDRGVSVISYFQVDNPLVQVFDPLFIGLHRITQSEMSSKAVTKADDLERVGNFCLVDGKLSVIEYSDLPENIARSRNADGSRRFDAGSIAIHLLDRAFVERLTAAGGAVQLPWHRAEKKVSTIDGSGRRIEPAGPNAVKLETFVFDAIPLARNPLVLYTPREEEFSPVKNAEGVDSPQTSRRDMVRRAARWLEAVGWRIPRDPTGEPDCLLEISPAFALDDVDLRERSLSPRTIGAGERVLLA